MWHIFTNDINEDLCKKVLYDRQQHSKYNIDGIVIAPHNDKIYERTSKNPKHKIAFKMVNEIYNKFQKLVFYLGLSAP